VSTTLVSVLLGVCGMLGWGVYDFLGGLLSKRGGSFAPLFWSQIVGAATVAVAALAAGTSWQLSLSSILLIPVAAGLYCGGYLFFFAGFEKGDVSVMAATMNVWAVVTMGVAFVFMGQRLSLTQSVGAGAILAGATLASINWTQVGSEGLRASNGVRETLAGAVFSLAFTGMSAKSSPRTSAG
jgi:bacterial/archaeal transporter family protein